MTFFWETFELTWMEGNLTVLWSRKCWYKIVRMSLLSSVNTCASQEWWQFNTTFILYTCWKQPPSASALINNFWHSFIVPSSHLSLTSSAFCPLKGLKPALCGDAGLQGEAWPDRPREALRLRLLSRPRFLSPPSRLTRRRSRRPVGGGWLSSSPSSCRRVIWGKSWLGVK